MSRLHFAEGTTFQRIDLKPDERTYAHWSVPQIVAELKDRFRVEVSADVVEDYTEKEGVWDAAKPMLEADSHAKVQMRRKVRGLRNIERRMLGKRDPQGGAGSGETPPPAPGTGSTDEVEALAEAPSPAGSTGESPPRRRR